MTVYGADSEELDRIAAVADEIDRNGGLLTGMINRVAWFSDAASNFLSGWSGVQLPRLHLATATDVVVTVPGTGTTLENLTTKDVAAVGPHYQDGDTAVITTLTWTPPGSIAANLSMNSMEGSLAAGPLPEILLSLDASGRSVVVTGHSAGAAALQTMLEQRPDLRRAVDGVALLAPSEFHPEFVAAMGDTPVFIAVHDDDPIQFAHLDEVGAQLATLSGHNVTFVTGSSGTSITGGVGGLIENGLQGDFANAHDQEVYARNHADAVTSMFPGSQQLDNGMIRQRFVDSDGTVRYVETGTF